MFRRPVQHDARGPHLGLPSRKAAQDGLEHIAQVKRAIVHHRRSDVAAGAEMIDRGLIDIGQRPEVLELAGPQVVESGRPLLQSGGAIRAVTELCASGCRDAPSLRLIAGVDRVPAPMVRVASA